MIITFQELESLQNAAWVLSTRKVERHKQYFSRRFTVFLETVHAQVMKTHVDLPWVCIRPATHDPARSNHHTQMSRSDKTKKHRCHSSAPSLPPITAQGRG